MANTNALLKGEATSVIDLDDPVALDELGRMAQELTGVQLTSRHRGMIGSRLQGRLREIGLSSLKEYIKYFKANTGTETSRFISLLTTHHTYFLREYSHFEYLLASTLPELLPIVRARPDRTLRIWSAACSRGQEAYSLAMFLDFHLKQLDPSLKFKILGTDIDEDSIRVARNGVYPKLELKSVPLSLIGSHWARGTGEIAEFVKVKDSLKSHCEFAPANLLAPGGATQGMFDIIFCRNVFIYFNSDQIRTISAQLMKSLNPDGFLFIGISESIKGLGLPVTSPGPSVYRHQGKVAAAPAVADPSRTPPTGVAKRPPLLRVVCVDDSASVLALLSKIITKENGMEIVGTAVNGIDAAAKIRELKPDVITLDIHMPEQDGLEYLEKNFSSSHPPVVMVSSVSREDSTLALRAFSAGASDYVEKPAMGNIRESGDELRAKLRSAAQAQSSAQTQRATQGRVTNETLEFKSLAKIMRPESKVRIIVLPLSARSRLKGLMNFFGSKGEPPVVILISGAGQSAVTLRQELSRSVGRTPTPLEGPAEKALVPDQVYSGDFAILFPWLVKTYPGAQASVMVLGETSQTVARSIEGFRGAQVLLEDLGDHKGCPLLMKQASDVVPATSFGYLSSEHLCKSG